MKTRTWLSFLALPFLISPEFYPFYLFFLLPFSWVKKRGDGIIVLLLVSSVLTLPLASDPSRALFFFASSVLIFLLFRGLNPEKPEKFLSLIVFVISLSAIFDGIFKGGRAFTFLHDPNLAAVLMGASLPVLTPPLSVLAIIGIAFTRSRAGFLIAFLALFIIFKKREKLLFLLLVLALLLVPNPLSSYLRNMTKDPFAFSRVKIWEKSLKILEDNPLGVGAMNYESWADAYRIPVGGFPSRYFKKAIQAHNQYLQFTVELGPFGIIASFLLLIFALKTKGKKKWVFLLLLTGAFFHSFQLVPFFWLPIAILSEPERKYKEK